MRINTQEWTACGIKGSLAVQRYSVESSSLANIYGRPHLTGSSCEQQTEPLNVQPQTFIDNFSAVYIALDQFLCSYFSSQPANEECMWAKHITQSAEVSMAWEQQLHSSSFRTTEHMFASDGIIYLCLFMKCKGMHLEKYSAHQKKTNPLKETWRE